MAYNLTKAGITTSNTIEAWHVTQSIDALTAASAYDITISGSLTLTGSLSISGSSGSLIVTGPTNSVTMPGFANATASWATNVINNPTTIDSFMYPSGGAGVISPIKLIAGYGQINSGSTSTLINITSLSTNTLGLNCFVSVGISSSYSTSSMDHFPRIDSLFAGNLNFSVLSAPSADMGFFFTIMHT